MSALGLRPLDYSLVLPAGWVSLPPGAADRDHRVGELLDRSGARAPGALREELRGEVERLLDLAAAGGALDVHLSLLRAGVVVLPAALVVTALPGAAAQELADAWSAAGVQPAQAAGTLALRRHRTVPAPAPAPTGPVVELLEHLVPFPAATDGALLLTFSHPLPALSEPLLELFDAVAASLRFVHPGSAR